MKEQPDRREEAASRKEQVAPRAMKLSYREGK
jgi:hypothetical protein